MNAVTHLDPTVLFPIFGVIAIVWGLIVAIFNEWSARWGSKMQSIYGRRAAQQVTPRLTRVTGIVMACMGALFIVLGLLGLYHR